MRKKGLIIPMTTWLRVSNNPSPDVGYIVNTDFLLESKEKGSYNMSLMWAEKGVYDLRKVLRGRHWSIHNLKL